MLDVVDLWCAEQLFAAHQGIANYPNRSYVRYRQHDSANHDTAFSRKRCGSECNLSPLRCTTIHYRSRYSPLYYTIVYNYAISAIVTDLLFRAGRSAVFFRAAYILQFHVSRYFIAGLKYKCSEPTHHYRR